MDNKMDQKMSASAGKKGGYTYSGPKALGKSSGKGYTYTGPKPLAQGSGKTRYTGAVKA